MGCGCRGTASAPRVLGKARVQTAVAPAPAPRQPTVRPERRTFTAYNGFPRKTHGVTE